MSVLRPICPICRTSEKLLRCQGCLVMLYCCREHQKADRNNHKVACSAVKNARYVLEREERWTRAQWFPENVFETGAGNFCEIFGTQNYIKARYSLVCKLMKINTKDAVKAACDHAMGILHLCHLDHVGARLIAPALFIRLGRDQECYDLIKWYTSHGMRSFDDWRIMVTPFLNVNDADAFESFDTFDRKCVILHFGVALMLIKIRILNDIRMLQNSLFMYDQLSLHLPPELVDRIRKEAIACEIVSKRKDIFKSNNQKSLIQTLEGQIMDLFVFVNTYYEHLWPALLDPKDSLALKPSLYKYETKKYSQMVVKNYYVAYAETPFAIEMVEMMMMDNYSRN